MGVDIEYIVLQQKYRKENNNQEDIFPDEWYTVEEYELKKKILSDCLSKNILIKNSSYYEEFRRIALG